MNLVFDEALALHIEEIKGFCLWLDGKHCERGSITKVACLNISEFFRLTLPLDPLTQIFSWPGIT